MSEPRVLVIEDNALLRRALQAALESGGFDVAAAADGAEALSRLRERRPDVVFQDLGLPDIDGVELLDRIRDLPAGSDVPVVALSGLESSLGRARRASGGFADCLIKPVAVERLLEVASHYVPTRGDASPTASRVGDGRRVLIVDDDPVQRKLLAIRLGQEGFEPSTAAGSTEALAELDRSRPDAIVSDVLMAEIDGFELVQRVRSRPDTAATPVVLASAFYVEGEDRELATQVGASDLIMKTPRMDGVIGALSAAMGAPVPEVRDSAEAIADRHFKRLIRQLARQEQLNRSLTNTVALQSAQLTVLAGISGVLRRTLDVERTITEVLERVREVEGVAGGAAMTNRAGDRSPGLLAQSGFGSEEATRALFERVVASPGWGADGLAVLGRRDVEKAADGAGSGEIRSVVALKMESGGDRIGALMLGLESERPSEDQLAFARTIASQVAESIVLARTWSSLEDARGETIIRLARAAEYRDEGTARHTERVGHYAAAVAAAMGEDEGLVEMIELAATMHDAGKVGVPDAILLKPGPLTDEEWKAMRRHAEFGHAILSGSEDATLNLAATIALSHHERWDGGGYPAGLACDDIPLPGRITAIADVFDAITSDRPYRGAIPVERAIEMIRAERGTHFDPEVADAFAASVERILEIKSRLADD